ncbi:MAG: energy-coupling factor ABC transporter ATP-binding protein [Phycisphaerae bacterium]
MSQPAILVEGLSYRYPDGTTALQQVDLRVERGSKVGLVGPNGAGKSTLLLCLDGFLASNGAVQIAGLAVRRQNLRRIRSHIGLVFQNPDDQLFMPRLFDDVAFGPINQRLSAEQVRQRVGEALSAVGLTGLEEKAPHHLSMGQKRNATLAAVLAMRPDLLLLDEPSANLDPRWRRRLMGLLAGLKTTMLIASHDLDLIAELCDRVVVLDGGRTVAEGPTGAILADAALMEAHGLEVPARLAGLRGG